MVEQRAHERTLNYRGLVWAVAVGVGVERHWQELVGADQHECITVMFDDGRVISAENIASEPEGQVWPESAVRSLHRALIGMHSLSQPEPPIARQRIPQMSERLEASA